MRESLGYALVVQRTRLGERAEVKVAVFKIAARQKHG